MKNVVVLCSGLLAGCASYRPVPTPVEHEPFRSYVSAATVTRGDAGGGAALSTVVEALSKYSDVTLTQLRSRAISAWNVADLTAIGASAAVLGAIADKTGLLNTGLAVAGVGTATSMRNQPDVQIDISLKTLERISCIRSRIAQITPGMLRLIRTSGDEEAKEALLALPEQVILQAEHVQYAHLAALYGIKATVPSKNDLMDYFSRYATATAAAAASARGANRSQESEAALKFIRTAAVEVEACARLP